MTVLLNLSHTFSRVAISRSPTPRSARGLGGTKDATRQPGPVPNWSVRIPALDGLRGIAILLVLLNHSVFDMHPSSPFLDKIVAAGQFAWSGVDLFFVLSGFLIGGILLDARESPRYFQTFYIRRAYRIFPLYFAITGLFLMRHLPFHLLPGHFGDVSPLTIPWWSYLTLTQNFWMAHLGWYGPIAMAVTWSLAVEEQFYLTVPLLVHLVRPERLRYVLLSVVVGAPVLRLLIRHFPPYGDYSCYVLMPCRADALCLGVLSALLVRSEPAWNLLLQKRKALYGAATLLFAGVAFMTYERYGQFSPPVTTFGYSVLAFFYTACLLIAVSNPGGSAMLRNRMLMSLGALAYCTYLIHFPLIHAVRRVLELHWSPDNARLPGALMGIALSLAIATLSWKYFEKPLLRRGHRYVY